MDSLIPVLVITVLVLLNGLFVAAEFAIVGVSRMEVEEGAREGRWTARLVEWVLAEPRRQDRFIATSQLGITVASLGLGMYGEHVLASWIAGQLEGWGGERWLAAHTAASIISVSILTYFHVVIGEMVPKSVALQSPARTVNLIGPPMLLLEMLAYPVIVVLNGIGNALLRVFGVVRSDSGADRYRTPEELGFIVWESHKGGLLKTRSAELLSDLLEFGDLTAAEVMIPRVRVTGIAVDADAQSVRRTLGDAPHTRYPVYDDTLDTIIGMLHVRDALVAVEAGRVGPELVRPVPHVPETASVDDVLAAMRSRSVQMVVVMDEHGGTAGIITLEDLFEEVVGDLTERPGDVAEIVEERGQVRADGAVRIEELGEALGVVLEHEEVDSVSGLVLSILGRPPVVGDTVEHQGVRIRVTSVQGRGVGAVVAVRTPRAVDDS